MADITSALKRIQDEEVSFRRPVSQSTMRKVGGTLNYVLDGFRIPAGVVLPFFGAESDVPSGWDVPDGRLVSRTGAYASLYAIAGPFCGVGNGTTTWNLPDMRGTVDRMVDTTTSGTKGLDIDVASRVLGNPSALPADPGSYQTDEVIAHTHPTPFPTGGTGGNVYEHSGNNPGDGHTTGSTGGSETRMKNMLVMKIIKL